MTTDPDWTPQVCTLPSVERPLRVAEFDELFASTLRELHRPSHTRLCLVLDPAAAETVRDLTARESVCCSFFAFTVGAAPDGLHLDVEVPDAQVAVLDALAVRAAASRQSLR